MILFYVYRPVTVLTPHVPVTMVVKEAVVVECIAKRMIPLGDKAVVVSWIVNYPKNVFLIINQ